MLKTDTTLDKVVSVLRFSFEIDPESEDSQWKLIATTPKIMVNVYKMFMSTAAFHLSIAQYVEATTYYKYAIRLADQCLADLVVCGVDNLDNKWLLRARACKKIYMKYIKKTKPGTVDESITQIWA